MKGAQPLVLGAGVTGLAAAAAGRFCAVEAAPQPGGLCASYYLAPEGRLLPPGSVGEGYRFEKGGGHWIFGGDPVVLRLVHTLSPCRRYQRHSAVYLPQLDRFVPFPLQNYLSYLPSSLAARALEEIFASDMFVAPDGTLRDWLLHHFGPTLCELFFFPFHQLYTAGLFSRVAPQDPYKSPVDRVAIARGAVGQGESAGYNQRFLYPERGLDHLVGQLAKGCQLLLGHPAVRIVAEEKELHLADGQVLPYSTLISTLPLSATLRLAGLDPGERPDPATGVLVVNVGGRRGPQTPPYHWVYFPQSQSGFHRVGLYSNVEPSFLPVRRQQEGVAIYVELAFLADQLPSPQEVAAKEEQVVRELQAMGWLAEVDVVDSCLVPVAYTWSWPGSRWKARAQELLLQHHIVPAGRFARWHFQGIAESLAEGLRVGAAVALASPKPRALAC